jgi:PqqD family protein of HPr-rel-A system
MTASNILFKSQWHTPERLLIRSWNSEFVVYDSQSGDTHLLGDTAGEILQYLKSMPSDVFALHDHLVPAVASERDESFIEQIDKIIVDLVNLSLIENVSF